MTKPWGPPRVFWWLLRAFPRRFRETYGDDMSADFARRLGDVRALGWRRTVAFWLRTGTDVVASGLAERRNTSFVERRQGAIVPRKKGGLMFGWTQDCRLAARRLRLERGYAAFVTLTLALGIGANVAVFSVVDAVLLRSLPYHEADRLIGVWGRFLPESGFDFPQFVLSNPEYFDYRMENRTMADVGAWLTSTATIGGPGEDPERIEAAVATPSMFSVLRARPLLGRLITESDPPPGPSSVVLLSHALWQRRFGGRADILGQRVTINGTPRVIIGVMPEEFDVPAGAKFWVPLVITSSVLQQRQSHGTYAIARLKDGVTLEQAQQEMTGLMQGWRERLPKIHSGHFLYLNPLMEDIVADVRPALKVVSAATGFLLLIVCANVASLALARAEKRSRESAIRAALGSGRWRLMRLAAVENGLLAIVGGAIGVGLAAIAVAWLRSTEGIGVPRLTTIGIDWRVWVFAAVASLLAACLLGALPAMRATAVRLAPALRLDTRTSTGAGRTYLRRSLVVMEVALAILLVTGAALMVRSFARLLAVDTGFRTAGVLLGTVSLPTASYQTDAHVNAFLDTALERLNALPGVKRATLATNLPVVSGIGVWDFEIEGRPAPGPGLPAWNAAPTFAAPGYFETVGMRLVRGRFFTTDDRSTSEPVALISEAFQRKYFPGEDPIGKRIRVQGNPKNAWAQVIGLVGDVRDQNLATEPRPLYFMLHSQTPVLIQGTMRQVTFALRADGDPVALAASLRGAIREIDAALPVSPIRSYEDGVARTVAQRRFTALILSMFAVFGLGLGVLGVYGVLAYTVAERTQEIGLRRALGAPAARVLQLVLTQGLVPVVIGIVLGIGATISARSVLETQLFGISPTDVPTYTLVAAGVLAAAVLACLIPARRALRVSPLVALREL
jgi:putative ABC transport system permease protein